MSLGTGRASRVRAAGRLPALPHVLPHVPFELASHLRPEPLGGRGLPPPAPPLPLPTYTTLPRTFSTPATIRPVTLYSSPRVRLLAWHVLPGSPSRSSGTPAELPLLRYSMKVGVEPLAIST